MGMFDSFYFAEGVLPINKEPPETEFQTKSLSCNLDVYHVDKFGFVKKCVDYGDNEGEYSNASINESAEIYSYDFNHSPTRKQTYKIIILNNKIVFAEKIHEEGYTE